jgi:hypothetical protein
MSTIIGYYELFYCLENRKAADVAFLGISSKESANPLGSQYSVD